MENRNIIDQTVNTLEYQSGLMNMIEDKSLFQSILFYSAEGIKLIESSYKSNPVFSAMTINSSIPVTLDFIYNPSLDFDSSNSMEFISYFTGTMVKIILEGTMMIHDLHSTRMQEGRVFDALINAKLSTGKVSSYKEAVDWLNTYINNPKFMIPFFKIFHLGCGRFTVQL